MKRRRFMALAAGAAVSGCGFQPVYMPTASGKAGVAQRELAAINVERIPDRPGQLLRQALQDRLALGSSGAQYRYDLTVGYGTSGEGIGVLPDDESTRVRLIATATWSLVAHDPGRTTLTKGFAKAVDAENVIDGQYFAADLEGEALQRRLADAIADQIAIQLATYFRARAAT